MLEGKLDDGLALLEAEMTPDELRAKADAMEWDEEDVGDTMRAAADAWEQDRRRLEDAHFMIGELRRLSRNERWMDEVDSP